MVASRFLLYFPFLIDPFPFSPFLSSFLWEPMGFSPFVYFTVPLNFSWNLTGNHESPTIASQFNFKKECDFKYSDAFWNLVSSWCASLSLSLSLSIYLSHIKSNSHLIRFVSVFALSRWLPRYTRERTESFFVFMAALGPISLQLMISMYFISFSYSLSMYSFLASIFFRQSTGLRRKIWRVKWRKFFGQIHSPPRNNQHSLLKSPSLLISFSLMRIYLGSC